MSPYYHPEKLELDMISFDDPRLGGYEYNTLCFWATKEGQIYSASDYGRSDSTPFEFEHDCPTRDKVLQTLERVGSVEQAESIFDGWNKDHNGMALIHADSRRKLSLWVSARLKP